MRMSGPKRTLHVIAEFRSRNMGLSRALARPRGAREVRRWYRGAATPIKRMGHAGAAPVLSPIIIVCMRPDVRRDLALLRQLARAYDWLIGLNRVTLQFNIRGLAISRAKRSCEICRTSVVFTSISENPSSPIMVRSGHPARYS